MGLGGLKFVSVIGLRGGTSDISLTIPISEITPSDVSIITELTPAQEEALDLIYRRKGRDWARYVVEKDVDDIVMDFGGQKGKIVYGGEIRSETISALKRRVRRVVGFDFVMDEFDSLNYIYDKVKRRETVVIDFGDYENNDWVIKLVTTIIARFLLNRFRGAKRKKIELPKTLIVLEESHKLLNRDIAKRTIFERIVREGRKFGLGLCVVDQMPRKILDEIISQLNTVVIMLLTNLRDREHLILSSENDLTDFKEEMRRLDVGEAIVTGISVPIPIPAKISLFKPKETEDEEDDFDWN
jgi:DNA helicase HerA-like ATPase